MATTRPNKFIAIMGNNSSFGLGEINRNPNPAIAAPSRNIILVAGMVTKATTYPALISLNK